MEHIDERTKETLMILQEECAEVTQAISKILRFGFDSVHPSDSWDTNTIKLENEVGDVLTMIDILVEQGVISESSINKAKIKKRERLYIWSNIFKNETEESNNE